MSQDCYIVGCKFDPENIESYAKEDPSKAVADAHDAEQVRDDIVVYCC